MEILFNNLIKPTNIRQLSAGKVIYYDGDLWEIKRIINATEISIANGEFTGVTNISDILIEK